MRLQVTRPLRSALAALLAGLLLALPTAPLVGHVERASASSVARAAERRPDVARHPKILVIAHRGFSAVAPENTLPAMTAAARAHADMVELDVQRTLDRQLIVVHDTTFARTTDIASVFPGRVNDPVGSFTLSEVKQLDAGCWKGTRYAGTRAPTLDELLTTMGPTSTNLLLELKNPALYPGYEGQVAAALASHGFVAPGRVYVHSFSRSSLEAFHRAAPSVPLGLLTMGSLRSGRVDSWLHTVNPTTGSVTDAAVDRASAANLQVFTWPLTVSQGSPSQVERMVDDGVSGIITDDPALVGRLVSSTS
ncbi:MAG: glycerophosphodiester phosphodiesterase [Marmoricola sp.]|nr:glycerophosphodiester phosphodiesterase [Marmoricola sp.]